MANYSLGKILNQFWTHSPERKLAPEKTPPDRPKSGPGTGTPQTRPRMNMPIAGFMALLVLCLGSLRGAAAICGLFPTGSNDGYVEVETPYNIGPAPLVF